MAPIPDEGSGTPTPDWAANGAELELDPKNFRNYGKNLDRVGEDLSGDAMSAQSALQGPGGRDMLMSTMFEPGTDMQAFADRNAQEMGLFIPDLYKNVTALSSVALIMGEVFENMDGNNAAMLDAIEWAFQMDGAKKPGDMPSWLTDERTVAKDLTQPPGTGVTQPAGDTMINQIHYGDTTITTYRTDDGDIRTVQTTGGKTIEYLDNKDGQRQYMITHTTGADQDTTVTTTFVNGVAAGESRRTTKHDVDTKNPNVVHEVTTTRNYDKNGDPIKGDGSNPSQHVVTYNFEDGSHAREYYTESNQPDVDDVDHDGNKTERVPTKTDQRTISPQHDVPTGVPSEAVDDLNAARQVAGG
ncbi:hypothetical protein GCM10027445_49090 [Amycolatopsis endophytica]|uniref:Uncharacterized protein n=1 Tax=Amycolatopsis endophytica TaxID=860233 RepID=A0A853BFA4_9PSEU|nr:hypothetical protein [Amycolatopsis endophytica]NYI93424.1 hypothetical protein [Amycolatopsis endophytica]